MRKLVIISTLIFSFFYISAQTIDLKEIEKERKNDYLIKISKEVIQKFGPQYYIEQTIPIINFETKTFIFNNKEMGVAPEDEDIFIKYSDRKYYEVIWPSDSLLRELHCEYAAIVQIWEDDGQPKEVTFGNGYGIGFYWKTFSDWVKDGIEDNCVIKLPQKHEISQSYIDYFKDF